MVIFSKWRICVLFGSNSGKIMNKSHSFKFGPGLPRAALPGVRHRIESVAFCGCLLLLRRSSEKQASPSFAQAQSLRTHPAIGKVLLHTLHILQPRKW